MVSFFYEYDGSLYFPANYNLTGNELWKLTTPDYSAVQQTPYQPLISVYPNPGSGRFYIKSEESGALQVSVMNLTGQIVLSQRMEGDQDVVEMSSYPAGTYLMKVETDNGVYVTKIVLQK